MNRTYKVIWSKARHCYVVVSELTKSQHKSSSKSELISANVHLGGVLGKAAVAAIVAGLLTFGGVACSPVLAAENTTVTDSNGNEVTNTDPKKDINANITGKNNKVTDSSNAEIVGDGNTVTNKMEGRWDTVRSNDVRIHGSGNFISGSRNQQVIGDNNNIIARDRGTVTDYQHPEGREENVSDLTIGRGNVIQSNDTYRNEWDSLKVIGNNNRADGEWDGDHAGGPSAGIVIGDNQNLNGIQDTIVIGSLAPSEQQKKTEDNSDLYTAGSNNIIIGYHTTTTQNGGIVIGNRSQGSGVFQTIMGPRSIIGSVTGNPDSGAGTMASIYGAFNKIEDAGSSNDSGRDIDGLGNSVNGSLNITSNARGTMIMGVGNTVTHAKGPDILGKDEDTPGATDYWVSSGLFGADYYGQGADTEAEGNNLNISFDEMRNSWQKYMETSGGAVSVLGNSNNADYAIRSQIIGTGNTINGSEKNVSAYNTVSGFANTGTNIKRSAIVGTGNTLKNGEDNVVIGDYHNLENGKHNVILGSMVSEEKQVTKKSKSVGAATDEHPDGTFEYTVTEQVPVKDHTKDIENAVMVGYNTDVTQNGGVALGADSVASTEAGIAGFDPQSRKHVNSEKDYSTWVSTDAAVSVGGADREVTYDVLDKDGKPVIDKATGKKKQETQIVKSTRQITNLAAGTEDTDAVNVAQLKSVNQKVAVVFDDKSSLMSTDATISHQILEDPGSFPEGEGQSIALGKNAHAYMQGGSKAQLMLFGMKKAAGAIAIGEGSEALSQSIDIGNRTYTGDMGDVTISKYGNGGSGSGIASVLLGTNSYTGGTLSTLIGDYSIMSTVYPNNYDSKKSGSSSYLQNAGAVSVGALNSIESATSSNDFSGVANSIVGLANKTNNANGALIYGAGNTITNSFADVATPDSAGSAAKAAQSFRKSVQNNPGGAALAIGGGNTIDRSIRSQVIGVNNKLTGNLYHEDGIYVYGYPIKPAVNEYSNQYNMVDGYNNQVANVNHAYVIGANNIIQGKTFTDATKNGVLSSKADRDKAKKDDNLIVIGDNHTLANDVSNNIILGTADKTLTTSVSNAVMIGHNADVQKNGGVALGADSIASTEAKKTGYDPQGKAHDASDAAWVSTDAAVSVGGADREVKYKDKEGKEKTRTVKSTRQITNVAAGTQDTDAVNVAQLKAISSTMNTDIAASKTHFYSVKSTDAKAKNYNNDGATAANALAAGVGANADKASAVAIGDTAYAGSANGVAIGTGSWIRSSDGKPNANGGDVAIGQDSHVDSYVNQGGSIALGQNARVENMYGNTEKSWALGQTKFDDKNIPLNPGNEAGGIAIGRNSFARTGSLMVGSHMYKGAIADIDEVDGTDSQKLRGNFNNINMTTLGTNSFNNGTFATVTGSYSATTAKKKIQNFAATVDGSLNSIESYKDAADNSGVASSIVGTANRIANSNNTTIIGAGNEVTNSLTDIKAPTEGGASAKALQDTLKDTLQNDAKGAVVVSGIGNKVDSANSISLSGSRNTVKNTKNAQLFGDNREVTNSNGVIIIGSADKTLKTTNVQNSTIIGHNANAQNDALAVGESASAGNNSIAIGMHASAGYSQNMALGYYANVANEVTNSTALGYGSQVTKRDILKSDDNEGVISVGKSVGQSGEKGMTRRIINVKAGVNDTDAVNVSQLKQQAQAATTEVMAGTNIASVTKNDKTSDGHTIYTVNAKGTTMSGDNNFTITATPNDATNVTDYKISLKNTIIIGSGAESSGAETHPITINGTDGVISGLINTTWDKNHDYSQSTKAATEAQLQNAMKDAQKAAEANDTDTHVKAGEYAVDTKHQVSMDIVDKEGKSTGNKITITDVAKASDVGDVKKLDADIQNADGKTTVVDAVNKVNGKVGDLNYSSTKYVTKGDSVTTSIGKLDEAIKSASEAAGKHTIVSTKDANLSVDNIAKVGEAANYQISMNKDLNVDSVTAANKIKTKDLEVTDSATIGKVTINKDNKGTIGGLTNKTWDAKNITSGQAATEDQLQAATKNAVNYDGDDSKTVTLREDTTIQNVANTTIEEGSKNAVNAGTVYNETRVAKDGNFVKQSNTAGENLSALDNQVTANTESIYHMNGRISDLDNRVNKVGAGAAALAALHPLDFDPDDKWDFAVGYGNYRNANSVALGAFYRPNEDTMFSLGTNFGNGENMFNAGVSFKIGQGSGITTSKTAMAKKIESLENTVDQQDKKIAELEALVKEQGEMIRQYVGKK